MDSFSVISLTSLCSTITHRSLSSKEELGDLIAGVNVQHAVMPQLSAFAAALQQLTQQATQLEKSLNDASVICEKLQTHMSQSLGSCDGTTAIVNKQAMRLQPEALDNVDETFLIVYNDVLVAYIELFEFFSNLLALTEKADQDAVLDAPDGKRVIEHAEMAALQASQIKEILLDGQPAESGSASDSIPVAGALQGHRTGEEPPPYEAETPSSPTQPAAAPGSSSSSALSKGVSSLTKSFKAFAAGFGSKPDPLVSVLCQAALRGDIQQMSGLLAQGANVNGRNDEGNTPLSCAILANQEDATRFLLGAGADHTSSDWAKLPPLFLASSNGSVQVAKLLLEQGAKVNEKSWSGQSFFVDVVASGNMDGIRLLLEHGANANTNTIAGKPVIADAVKKGNIELVELLLKHGAKASSSDNSGSSLISLAAGKENVAVMQLLLDHGGNPSSRSYTGNPVVAECISKRRLELAKMLIERGADPNVRDLYGHPILFSLIRHPKVSDDDKIEIARLLLAKGASPNVSDSTWGTPLICLVMEYGNSEILNLMLQHGVDTSKKMGNGDTLLMYAMDRGRRDQVKSLVEHGADPNVPDKKGRVALMSALAKQDVELIRVLRQHGADVNTESKVSAADFANTLGKPEIFEALGIDPKVALASRMGYRAPMKGSGSDGVRVTGEEPLPPGYDASVGRQ